MLSVMATTIGRGVPVNYSGRFLRRIARFILFSPDLPPMRWGWRLFAARTTPFSVTRLLTWRMMNVGGLNFFPVGPRYGTFPARMDGLRLPPLRLPRLSARIYITPRPER